MSTNKLMQFRTTYLRAIAQAWSEQSFHDCLTQDPCKALADYFGYHWPWKDVCDLEIKAAPDQFKWIGHDWVWSKSLADTLTLALPLKPPSEDADYNAMALADFYKQRASLFSDDWGTKYDENGPKGPRWDSDNTDWRRSNLGETGSDSPPPVGGFIPDDAEFPAFKVALLAAMAKAWNDDAFRETLEVDPAVALHAVRGYKVPWKMMICVKEDTTSKWHAPSGPSSPRGEERPALARPKPKQSYWEFDEKHKLTLYLPTKPSDPKSEPLALAIYNATGAEYPFTCCT
ncbi:BMA_0021/BMA_0022 family TOMM bacteriocin [Sorangium sp. So ce375]|uniref:BMA_0021/BMA_0022 family TOMM bacteriocin n=1 Tax=Sorangium sp. So ce375 TaxID=3133306 RepID=UPI003F5B430C